MNILKVLTLHLCTLAVLTAPVNAVTIVMMNEPPKQDMVIFNKAINHINSKFDTPLLRVIDKQIFDQRIEGHYRSALASVDIVVSPILWFDDRNVLGKTSFLSRPRYIQYDQFVPERSKLATLIHEIGHALGLPHTSDTNSIMYRSEEGAGPDFTDDEIQLLKFIHRKQLGYELVKRDNK